MKFNSLDELPENGSLVWVKLYGLRPFKTIYENDSFGLGDRDFEVTGWSNCLEQPLADQASLDYKQRSTRRAWGHNTLHSSELSLSLVR